MTKTESGNNDWLHRSSAPALTVSDDGYIRLTWSMLLGLDFSHLTSGLDEEPGQLRDAATTTLISGYTEWISNTWPAVSIGWDWLLDMHDRKVSLRRINDPRSNILLQRDDGRDCPSACSAWQTGRFVDRLDWISLVGRHIGIVIPAFSRQRPTC